MPKESIFEELSKKLPRREDQMRLKRIFTVFEEKGKDGVMDMLEEEVEKIAGEQNVSEDQ
jgi:hypothetical protein